MAKVKKKLKPTLPATIDLIEKLDSLIALQEEVDTKKGLAGLWPAIEDYLRLFLPLEAIGFFVTNHNTHEFILDRLTEPEGSGLVLKEFDHHLESGTLGWVVQRGLPAMVPIASREKGSGLLVPFRTIKKTYGIALAITSAEADSITLESMAILSFMARQVGLILENVETYNNLVEAYEALYDAQKRIIFAEKMSSIGRLASRASHEILNPLNIIMGNAQLILMKEESQPYLRYVERIIDQSKRIEAIVKGLIKASESSGLPKEKVDIKELFQKAVSITKKEWERANINVELLCNTPNTTVWGNSVSLLETFIGIIKNSIDAMASGGMLTIRLEKDQEETETLRIEIVDTGEGISPENLDKLFEPFFTTSQNKHNIGLGLYIAYGVIRDHEGDIKVESAVGQGTKVVITLPLYDKFPRGG